MTYVNVDSLMVVGGIIGVDNLMVVGGIIVVDGLCKRRGSHGGWRPYGG